MMPVGLIPLGLLAYGLYSKRRGFIWVGGAWAAADLLLTLFRGDK